MRVRELEPRDIPAIQEFHTQSGFDYRLPDFFAEDHKKNPLFPAVRVLVDENDLPIQVVAAKKTVEIYFLLDSTWRNPRWRLDALMQVHEDMRKVLLERGYEDANCWLPPEVEKSFGRRLMQIFRWTRGRWQSYSRRLRD